VGKVIAAKVYFMMFFLVILLPIFHVSASDLAREQRWAEQTVDSILDGEAVWLERDSRKIFLSIYTEAETPTEMALLVLHGTGIHPNWQQVIQPVRVELTSYGWNTLSIQMPILSKEAAHSEYGPLYPEVHPRIESALKFLTEQGNTKIVVVAHSQGAAMAVFNLSTQGSQEVKGLVAIGMGGGEAHADQNVLNHIGALKLPVLDLFGSEDLESVLFHSEDRLKIAIEQGNDDYTQLEIDGANHFFDDMNDELISVINDWLSALD
jgi:hypothetical protein